ncbi:MAG TPA: hypothetical protein VIG48_10230 [Jatrophihabitans sp.]|jgi:hypothetical protein
MNVPLAHAFGERIELPIPVLAFVLGGAAVVAVSFAVVLPTGVKPAPDEAPDTVSARRVSMLAGVVGVILLAALCWAGFTGVQDIPENILPTAFWVYVWVVLPLASGLIGDFTSGVNPYGFLAQLGERIGPRARTWPKQLGWWPAVVLLALGTLAELIFNKTTTLPAVIAWMLVGYAAYCLLMGAVFGARAFREHGELFTVLFSTWGRLGYYRFGAPGRRGIAGGLEAPFQRSVSRTVFVLMLLVSISFDGILATPQWAKFENAHIAFGDLHAQELFRTVAFLVLTLVIYGVFLIFSYAVARAGGLQRNVGDTFAHLLPSLVPIAFGYLLAHYLQYVLINGQLLLPLLGAPGGTGTNLHLPYPFNDSYEVNTTFLPNSFYWYVDVLVIVGVHILAVVLAHRSLARVSSTERTARRAEYPWIVAMVAYTALSLWLLAQPLAQSGSGAS